MVGDEEVEDFTVGREVNQDRQGIFGYWLVPMELSSTFNADIYFTTQKLTM